MSTSTTTLKEIRLDQTNQDVSGSASNLQGYCEECHSWWQKNDWKKYLRTNMDIATPDGNSIQLFQGRLPNSTAVTTVWVQEFPLSAKDALEKTLLMMSPPPPPNDASTTTQKKESSSAATASTPQVMLELGQEDTNPNNKVIMTRQISKTRDNLCWNARWESESSSQGGGVAVYAHVSVDDGWLLDHASFLAPNQKKHIQQEMMQSNGGIQSRCWNLFPTCQILYEKNQKIVVQSALTTRVTSVVYPDSAGCFGECFGFMFGGGSAASPNGTTAGGMLMGSSPLTSHAKDAKELRSQILAAGGGMTTAKERPPPVATNHAAVAAGTDAESTPTTQTSTDTPKPKVVGKSVEEEYVVQKKPSCVIGCLLLILILSLTLDLSLSLQRMDQKKEEPPVVPDSRSVPVDNVEKTAPPEAAPAAAAKEEAVAEKAVQPDPVVVVNNHHAKQDEAPVVKEEKPMSTPDSSDVVVVNKEAPVAEDVSDPAAAENNGDDNHKMGKEDVYRQKIIKLVQTLDPESLNSQQVDTMLLQFRGREDELMESLQSATAAAVAK